MISLEQAMAEGGGGAHYGDSGKSVRGPDKGVRGDPCQEWYDAEYT